MLTSFKLFYRSLRRNKLFSSINILGLTVGFFASILIYIYVQNELSYDQFHEHGDRIYRVNQTFIWGEDNSNLFSSTGPGVGYAIAEEIPEAKQVVRIHTPSMTPITFKWEGQERFFKDEYIFAVDSNFFEVFTFPLQHGDQRTALEKPKSVVLTAETAKRFFGNVNPVGEIISMDNGEFFTVTGVLEPIQGKSYLDDFDLLVSLNSIDRIKRSNWNWMWTMFETFILTEEGVKQEVLQAKINELPKKHADKTLEAMGYTYEEYIEAGKEWNLYLQPFTDIYLHSDGIYNRLSQVGDFKIVTALIGSAIFLVILSCINFINLSTAQFTTKAHDVALRKVLGGSKAAFIRRFFGESLAYSLIAATVAATVLFYTMPFINQSVGTTLSFDSVNGLAVVGFMALLVVLVSVVSGFYPFIFFNSFKPVAAMKGEMKTGKRGLKLRNAMLVTQYVLSFLLIIGTITIYKQLDYFIHADLGFEKENLISVENVQWTGAQAEFANELEKIEGVVGASVCDAVPLLISNGDQFIPDEPNAGSVPLNYALGDEKYIDLLKIEMLVGRGFDKSYSEDVNGIILNETAARTIGWKVDESILNKKITNWSGTYHVIGVTSDFNFWSLHAQIEPFAIFHSASNAQGGRPLTRVMVKTRTTDGDMDRIKQEIATKWEEFAPGRPYEQVLISEHFESSYQTEQRFGSVLTFFAALTIIIASLGLFGIVVFAVEQKLKEIGVRKVLGASISSIIVLFSKNYIKLLLVGFLIAAPLGYYFMNIWLSDFEYHINMTVDIFVLALITLLFISLAISIFHTTKASLMNPADVLKDE
ncbi:MAG: ABC transporter permease [Ekhidna sp.]|uniref:ABC transporter permease n=1 Tax=Ekhidna sp. TaxID=2608089 RepID=UPI0032EB9669